MHYGGFHTDSAWTYAVGKILPEKQRLLDVTEASLWAGIAETQVGNHIGDIGAAVERVVVKAGFSVVRDLVGHGVGQCDFAPRDRRLFWHDSRHQHVHPTGRAHCRYTAGWRIDSAVWLPRHVCCHCGGADVYYCPGVAVYGRVRDAPTQRQTNTKALRFILFLTFEPFTGPPEVVSMT